MLDSHAQPSGAQNETLPVEFTFENQTVRTITRDGEIWFVATDVCQILDLENPTKTVARLDDDERALTTIQGNNREREANIVNECGLYSLIFTSRKPEAKAFRRWVTHEVLPSIRRTGRYEAGPQEAQQAASPHIGDFRKRFHKIYADGSLDPDDLLVALFGTKIPFTEDPKHRFFADETSYALGLTESDPVFDRIPKTEITTLVVDSPKGPLERRAISEAALYFLAFRPRGTDANILAHFIATLNAIWLKLQRGDPHLSNDQLQVTFDAVLRSASTLAAKHLAL